MKKQLFGLVLSILFPLVASATTTISPILDPINDNLAGFYFEIDKASFFNPDYFYTDLKIDTGNQNINAVSLNFNFPVEKLQLEEVKINPKICGLKIIERIDNENGSLTLICASSQSFNASSSSLAELIFKKLETGKTALSIESASSLYQADGLGQRIPIIPEQHNIYLIK